MRGASGNWPRIAWLPMTTKRSCFVTSPAARSTCSSAARVMEPHQFEAASFRQHAAEGAALPKLDRLPARGAQKSHNAPCVPLAENFAPAAISEGARIGAEPSAQIASRDFKNALRIRGKSIRDRDVQPQAAILDFLMAISEHGLSKE